jgi:hypothetical protein
MAKQCLLFTTEYQPNVPATNRKIQIIRRY